MRAFAGKILIVFAALAVLIAASPREIRDFPLGTPAADDYVLTQTAAGATQQYPVEDLLTSLGVTDAYGEIYELSLAGGTPVAVGTAYVGWTTATVGTIAGGTHVTVDVASVTADSLIIGADGAGLFDVKGNISFSGSGSDTFTLTIFKNGAASHISLVRKLGTGGDVGSASLGGLLTLADTDYVDLRVKSQSAGNTWTPFTVNLRLVRFKG